MTFDLSPDQAAEALSPLDSPMPTSKTAGAVPATDPIAAAPDLSPFGVDTEIEPEPLLVAPPTPEALALGNARNGRWAMSEWYDGLVWLGADDKPVMRKDGSRVGFRFWDLARLTKELAAADDMAGGAGRMALAPLDSGYNKDWDPKRPKSTMADMTKWTRLLAYHYVQTTEPEEAVRRAVSTIFGNPITLDRAGTKLWVPTKYDPEPSNPSPISCCARP